MRTQPVTAGEPGLPGILWSVDWSADGKRFAVGGEWVGVFDADTYARRHLPALDVSTMGTKVRWHPHRRLLAVSRGSGEDTAIFDETTDQKITLKTKEGTRGIAWNATGERLATAGNDGSLQIWSADGKLQHTTRQEMAKGLTGVTWHPAEDKLITVGEFITLHDGKGTILMQVRHRPDTKGFCLLLCVEWHPSGTFFVVGDYGNHDTGELPVLQFWSADLRLLKTITSSEPGPFRNISWNREGTRLASASDALRIWSKEGDLLHLGKSPDLLWGVRWNRDGDRLLTADNGGQVTLWTDSAKEFKNVIDVSDLKRREKQISK